MLQAGARVLTLDQLEGLKVGWLATRFEWPAGQTRLGMLVQQCVLTPVCAHHGPPVLSSPLTPCPATFLPHAQDPGLPCWTNEADCDGDPPRLWSPNGMFPGTAFTRSIGDSGARCGTCFVALHTACTERYI